MIEIRKATLADAERVFRLANDPTVRAVSFQSEPIAWANHWAWYQRAVEDPRLLFFLGFETGAGPEDERFVGQVRLKGASADELVLSISVAPTHRTQGRGRQLLAGACLAARRELGPRTVIAEVRWDNEASRGFFSRLGGQMATSHEDPPRLVYTFSLDQLAFGTNERSNKELP